MPAFLSETEQPITHEDAKGVRHTTLIPHVVGTMLQNPYTPITLTLCSSFLRQRSRRKRGAQLHCIRIFKHCRWTLQPRPSAWQAPVALDFQNPRYTRGVPTLTGSETPPSIGETRWHQSASLATGQLASVPHFLHLICPLDIR